jgi:hypothetical protein
VTPPGQGAGGRGAKGRDNAGGLLPLSQFALGNAGEAAQLERLRRAWPLMVGPGLGRDTHPISTANGLLLIGCHSTFALKSMRASVESAWPDLRRRIDAAIGSHMQRVEITPSDPPEREAPPGKAQRWLGRGGAGPDPLPDPRPDQLPDPLAAVLAHYGRVAGKGGGGEGSRVAGDGRRRGGEAEADDGRRW